MKRFRKALLALATLLGVVIAGGIWLINSALNVASDVVDSTLGGAQKVQAVAQREVVGVTRSAQNGAKAAIADAEHSLDAPDKPAPSLTAKTSPTPSADKTPEQKQSAGKVTSSTSQSSSKHNTKDKEDTLADVGQILSIFFNDGEDDSNLTGLLKSGDKEAAGDSKAKSATPNDKNADDTLTDMIPGANSPTVKGWMAGKYKGKEGQALDDALEDPKILRLIFFLAGGM